MRGENTQIALAQDAEREHPDPAATRLQPASVSTSLPVLAVRAHERAPTLMASASAGRQGEVRIWTPKRRLIWGRLGIGVFWLLFAPRHVFGSGPIPGIGFIDPVFYVMILSMGVGMIVSAVKSLRTPAYLSTDDKGLALATAKGGRALQWDDLAPSHQQSLSYTGSSVQLTLKSGEKAPIDLTGYDDHSRRQLLSLLERKLKRRILFRDPSIIGTCWATTMGGRCGAPARHVDERLGYAVCNRHAKQLQGKRRKALPG